MEATVTLWSPLLPTNQFVEVHSVCCSLIIAIEKYDFFSRVFVIVTLKIIVFCILFLSRNRSHSVVMAINKEFLIKLYNYIGKYCELCERMRMLLIYSYKQFPRYMKWEKLSVWQCVKCLTISLREERKVTYSHTDLSHI